MNETESTWLFRGCHNIQKTLSITTDACIVYSPYLLQIWDKETICNAICTVLMMLGCNTREMRRCGDEERVASENCSTLWIVYYEIFSGIISFYLCNKHSTLLGVCVRVCVCVLCDARLFGFSHLVISKYENQFYVLVCLCTSAKRTTSLDSGTINETHEYILKDISIKSRSKSQLYCTRSDADKMCARCWVLSSCNHSPNPQQRTPTFRCKSTSSTSISI